MKKKIIGAAVALGLFGGIAIQAYAQQANPAAQVNQRKAAMTLQGKYFGSIGAMVQGRVPYDAKIVQRNSDFLAALAQMAWDGFDPATATAANTRAKPEIYKDTAKFKAEADAFQAEVTKLATAAHAGDQNAVRAAFGAVGKTCQSCHDAFRTAQ